MDVRIWTFPRQRPVSITICRCRQFHVARQARVGFSMNVDRIDSRPRTSSEGVRRADSLFPCIAADLSFDTL